MSETIRNISELTMNDTPKHTPTWRNEVMTLYDISQRRRHARLLSLLRKTHVQDEDIS